LAHKNNPVALGVEKTAVIVLTSAAGPAMDNQNGNTIRIAAFFNIQFMGRINRNAMLGVGLDIREQGEHEALRTKDLTGV
jgi:hypothetical protein